jgi:hypothetical protein
MSTYRPEECRLLNRGADRELDEASRGTSPAKVAQAGVKDKGDKKQQTNPLQTGKKIIDRAHLERIVSRLAEEAKGQGPGGSPSDFVVIDYDALKRDLIEQSEERSCLLNSVRYVVQKKYNVILGRREGVEYGSGDRVMWSIIHRMHMSKKRMYGTFSEDAKKKEKIENHTSIADGVEWLKKIGVKSEHIITANLADFLGLDKNATWKGNIFVVGVYRGDQEHEDGIDTSIPPIDFIRAAHTLVINEAMKEEEEEEESGNIMLKVYDPLLGENMRWKTKDEKGKKSKERSEWVELSYFLTNSALHSDKVRVADPEKRSKLPVHVLIVKDN